MTGISCVGCADGNAGFVRGMANAVARTVSCFIMVELRRDMFASWPMAVFQTIVSLRVAVTWS
jgi:hypothetical protein